MGCPTCGGVAQPFVAPEPPVVWSAHGTGFLHVRTDEAAMAWVDRRGGRAYLTDGTQYGTGPKHPEIP